MITKQEIEQIVKLKGEGFLKAFICDVADFHINNKILNTLEKGSFKYNALKKYNDFFEDFLFVGKGDKPIITKEESKLLKEIPNASDELVEKYKKEVEKILKDMD